MSKGGYICKTCGSWIPIEAHGTYCKERNTTPPEPSTTAEEKLAWGYLVKDHPWVAKDEYYEKNPTKSMTFNAYLAGLRKGRELEREPSGNSGKLPASEKTIVVGSPVSVGASLKLPDGMTIDETKFSPELMDEEERIDAATRAIADFEGWSSAPQREEAYKAGCRWGLRARDTDISALRHDLTRFKDICAGHEATLAALQKQNEGMREALQSIARGNDRVEDRQNVWPKWSRVDMLTIAEQALAAADETEKP